MFEEGLERPIGHCQSKIYTGLSGCVAKSGVVVFC